jgi:hypothetical protein
MDLRRKDEFSGSSGLVDNKQSVSDFVLLREKLQRISAQHIQSLWAENGGMEKALQNRFMGQKYFSEFRPDILLMNLDGTPSQQFKYFVLAKVPSSISH